MNYTLFIHTGCPGPTRPDLWSPALLKVSLSRSYMFIYSTYQPAACQMQIRHRSQITAGLRRVGGCSSHKGRRWGGDVMGHKDINATTANLQIMEFHN